MTKGMWAAWEQNNYMKHPGLSSFWESYESFLAEDPDNADLGPDEAWHIWQEQEGWAELNAILAEEGKTRRKRKKTMKKNIKIAVAVALGALLLATTGSAHQFSARANVGTGTDVLIGGIIVEERDCPPDPNCRENCRPVAAAFVIRVLGPSLHDAGIENYLRDPQVLFYDGEGNLVGGQLDYSEVDATTQYTIWQHGLAPEYIEEVALYVILLPGTYTAVVSGQDGGTGVAILEAYKL